MESLTIIFKDHESIWVIPKHASTNIIFNRWWTPKGSYTEGWQDFRRKLYRNKKLDLAEIYRFARRFQIQSMGTTRAPTINGKPLKLIYERRKARRKK